MKAILPTRAAPSSSSEVAITSTTAEPKTSSDSPPQRFFLRADKLENAYPGLTVTTGQALGASFAYTRNAFVQSTVQTKAGPIVNVSSSDSLVINGLASYAFVPENNNGWFLAGQENMLYVPSLWVSANGNWDNPTKPFGDTSALKVGPEVDFLFLGKFDSYVGLAPFYQTDFYGRAKAEGGTVSWTPSYHNLFLNGAPDSFKVFRPTIIDGFLELRAEATYLSVTQPGQTNLNKGSYEWFGGAARSYVFFFPTRGGEVWPSEIADKISFVGTIQYYWDANSNATARLLSAALQYKLACDARGETMTRTGEKIACTGGSPSVAVQYDWGTDRDTLQQTRKISAKLTYAW
jgi:hypothetical protein